MKAVVVNNICKSYEKGKVEALKNISIEVDDGELYGLIGPDGAGKSTLFDILVTLISADSGEAMVKGFDVTKNKKEIRKIIGYMPGRFSLYQDLTVRENLEFFATIFGGTIEQNYDLIKDIWVQIEPFSKRQAGKLSGGMKQKLALCCALVHKPEVLFLDEPTTGVDPVSRREFWGMLKNLKRKGISIVVSTPYMDEAVLCDRVALIQNGDIMAIDTPANIVAQYDKNLYAVEGASVHQMLLALRNYDGVHSCHAFGQIVHMAVAEGIGVGEIVDKFGFQTTQIMPSIEDCFMEYMSKMK